MSIEITLAKLQQQVTEQTDECAKLVTSMQDSWQEIDQVHNIAKHNHQAVHDWQTKTGQVTLKDLDNKAYQVDTLATLINETQKINPHPEVMSKAQFDALRQMRKQQYAGSGFVEWGKHINTPQYQSVNEGMWTWLNRTNSISLGVADSDIGGIGVSRSNRSKVLVDGVFLALSKVAHRDYVLPILPPAPDGTKTYDSSTGKVTQHANAIEAFNECNTRAPNGSAVGVYDIEAGIYSFNGTSAGGFVYSNKTASGSHQVEIVFSSSTDTLVEFRDSSATNGSDPLIKSIQVSANTKDTIKFTHNFANGGVYLRVSTPVAGQQITIHSWQTLPSTEQVITSRKDLVFLESWHEKIADKDVVYPLGNVQFGASAYEGMSLANNLVAQGYSAFGEWDENTKGHGVKWSTLSAANRVKFLKNPEHNIYYDPEAKAYIQVRYRVRVVEGLGDNWNNNRFLAPQTVSYFHYLGSDNAANSRIITRGQLDTNLDVSNVTSGDYVNGYVCKSPYDLFPDKDSSHWQPRNNQNRTCAYKSQCFAIPIALVQRLNQGAYHPVYNPMGCGIFAIDSAPTSQSHGVYWYNNVVQNPLSTSQCFDTTIARVPAGGVNWGGLSIDYSGRLDQYKYHDAIYAGQVEDLRLNANKLDVNQLREDTMRKAVAGTLRGKGKVPFTRIKKAGSFTKRSDTVYGAHSTYNPSLWRLSFEVSNSTLGNNGSSFNGYKTGADKPAGDWVYYVGSNGKSFLSASIVHFSYGENQHYFLPWIEDDINGTTITSVRESVRQQIDEFFPIGTDIDVYVIKADEIDAEFDSLPWVDIIGHPERIVATFPDGVIGQWLPKVPYDGMGNVKLNRKATTTDNSIGTVLYTANDGASWAGRTQKFSHVSNELTLDTTIDGPDKVVLINYQTLANCTHTASLLPTQGGVSNVYATQAHRLDYGNRLQQSVIGQVGVRADSPYFQEELAVTKLGKHYTTGKLTWTNREGDEPRHEALSLDSQAEPSSAVKTLSTIVEQNGLLYLQFNGAELKYTQQPVIDISESSTEPKTAYGVYRVTDGPLKGRLLKRMFSTATAVPFNDADWSIDNIGLKYQNNNADYSFKFFTDDINWGDDQTIPIVNGENTKTDLNGNTVKVFCHHTQLPLGIASH
ncbi:hypothetical protein PSECIP111951_01158 [Pseudoalteromonas holothuriae]|uniref:Uncharacterized protein n=1 Tax=Pseudoalteromonas holothuriae TaxID=2963714 RepID=A0ABM9GFX3_9GAMM|nr:hypothetical protein [Pseudoalteromonas sp. CIP111951]CAH9055030.1 hypothetical protein PSECIP111951_01158 [Pseudoalteromonas sp. CIP111951]